MNSKIIKVNFNEINLIKYLFFMVLFLFVFMSCGPVRSTMEIHQAEVEVQSAYRVQAHKTAPYYYYKAKAYLTKAKNERAYSDFDEANLFASKSVKLAIKAKEIASKDESSLLEEKELKLRKDSTDNRDTDENIEYDNKKIDDDNLD